MAGEPYTALGEGCSIGPPNIGLSPERIQELSQQGRIRIAAENAAKEAQRAERAELKAAAKAKKSAERENMPNKNHKSQTSVNDSGGCLERCYVIFNLSNDYKAYLNEHQHEKKSWFGKLQNLLKREKDSSVVR